MVTVFGIHPLILDMEASSIAEFVYKHWFTQVYKPLDKIQLALSAYY